MTPNLNPCPSISVVVVTYNSAEVLRGLLDSLPTGLDGVSKFEVVVVDNASSDQSTDIALAHPISPKVIDMGRNAGYAAGINAAETVIPQDRAVLILNPDIRLRPGAAWILLERAADPKVGVAVPQILNEDGTVALSLRREPSIATAWTDALLGGRYSARLGTSETIGDLRVYRQDGLIDWATGAALLVTPQARRIVGRWDESFFLYSEEVDYLQRVRECGLTVAYSHKAKVTHIGGDYQKNPRLYALLVSNRIRYFRRHHGTLATAVFRLAILVGAAMRYVLGPSYRAVFRAALVPVKPPR
ncbi:glycosyl transferase (plasmid) [Microvirga ossetica]|uniref:Glycosyl transferase n=1 Tax=Microvirga ossetica TaxID=1882682 RepID=A0A1B2EQG6_9HYPH|nr:glycosyltransferase family 2 protein [Microvirga ossetica]ANY82190.1 glycosyl transferase [Microvirga ossetica]